MAAVSLVREEQALLAQGYTRIAGIDEVGRGCWAGPVVAAAVIFPPQLLMQPEPLAGITDSKLLTAGQRRVLAARIETLALAIGVGAVPVAVIDVFGIGVAARLAMIQAVLALTPLPDTLLIDWVRLKELALPQRSFARADQLSVSVAAASIIAKTRRDAAMEAWGRADPRYGWERHKGYGTALHQRALGEFGPTALHRHSFRPVQAALALAEINFSSSSNVV